MSQAASFTGISGDGAVVVGYSNGSELRSLNAILGEEMHQLEGNELVCRFVGMIVEPTSYPVFSPGSIEAS